jgi:hypothetical protein
MRRVYFPTIIAVVFLLVGLATGVVLVQYNQEYRTSASSETNPKNVRITNINRDSFTVTWTTDKEADGFVKYTESGLTSEVALDKFSNSFTHHVEIKNLKSNVKYSFQIGSGSETYDNNGIEWIVETSSLPNNTGSISITGKVLGFNETPIENALVYITAGSSSTLSTTTSQKGVWIINLSDLKTSDLSSFQQVDQDTILEISVQAGSLGTSSAKILTSDADPVPNMQIGSSHDFRNTKKSEDEVLPNASLELPKTSTAEAEPSENI